MKKETKLYANGYRKFGIRDSIAYAMGDLGCNMSFALKGTMSIFWTQFMGMDLWHGRRNPYLYCCEVEVVEDGEVVDNVCSRFGCRSYKIDPDNGFILNGEEYPLRGQMGDR